MQNRASKKRIFGSTFSKGGKKVVVKVKSKRVWSEKKLKWKEGEKRKVKRK